MSFSAEMKDFLGAWEKGTKILGAQTDEDYKKAQTDALTKKTVRENDPETLKLAADQARADLAKTNAGIALTNEQVKNAGVSRGYTAALTDRMKQAGQPQPDPGSGLLPPAMAPGAAVGGGVAPLQNTMQDPTLSYAGGGAIPDGDGPDEEPDDDEPGPAVGSSDTTDISARSRGGGQSQLPQGGFNGVVAPQLIHDAVKGGYSYGIKAAGLGGGVRSARQQQSAKAIAAGAGGLTHEEMEAAKKAVDPESKMTDSQRNMAALGAVYQFWANKGDPEKAQKVAFQMLQSFRLASQRYAAIAAHAAEQGNMDLATKAAVKAYANVPDGRDMTMSLSPDGHIQYHYMDENGKTITKGLATPQELASSAMGLARGGFDQAILSAAGVREDASKAVGGKGAGTSKGNAVSDMKNTGDLLDKEMGGLQEQWQKKNSGKELDQDYWGTIKDAATHIMQQNPKATPREALASAQALMNPKTDQFKTTSEGGQNTVKFKDGTTVTLDDNQFDALITKRAEARKAQLASEDQAAEDAKKPSRAAQAWEGAKKVGSAVGDIASTVASAGPRAAAAVGDAVVPDEMKERGKSALRAAGDAAVDFGRRVADPGNIPAVAAYRGIKDIDPGAVAGAIKTGVQSALEALSRGTQNPGAIPSSPDEQQSPPI